MLFLGLVSFFTDASSEMIFPLLPVFLTTTLGAGAMALGWVEGLANFCASVLRLISGALSDKSQKRRPLVLAGYGLSSVVRPLMALAGAPAHVLAVRVADRIGKGLRGSPRDALIAESVPAAQRAEAFGWHRSMDHAGAMVGPLVAWALLSLVDVKLRTLFVLAAVPGVFALACVLFGVREPREAHPPLKSGSDDTVPWEGRQALARFLAPFGLFTLGRASDAFLLLLVSAGDSPLETLPLIWVGCNALRTVAAFPAGRLADRMGRRRVILAGWWGHVLACLSLAATTTTGATLVGIALWVTADGMSEGAEKATISQLAPRRRHGTAFGFYHLTQGVLTLAASVLFGGLFEFSGRAPAFLTSAGLALVAALWLMTIPSLPGKKTR